MYVRALELQNFRNYEHLQLQLQPGVMVFSGHNGEGKTNLIEAVRFLSVYSSHRVSQQGPLIRSGADEALIRAEIVHDERHIMLDAMIRRTGQNTTRLNGSVRRVGELIGQFHTVLFAPEDLALVQGAPDVRRRFVDDVLTQMRPRYGETRRDYDRVLHQRNSLLKSARVQHLQAEQLTTLDVWDDQLVALGTELIAQRVAFVERLRPKLAAAYREIAGTRKPADVHMLRKHATDPSTGIERRPGESREQIAAELGEQLHAARTTDVDRGATSVGPHRDDLDLTIDGLTARDYASHGESWSLALALKLAAAAILREVSIAGDPVLILDDVFAELDATRRERLATLVAGYEQVLITAAVARDIPRFASTSRRWPVHAGQLGAVETGAVLETRTVLKDVASGSDAGKNADDATTEVTDVPEAN